MRTVVALGLFAATLVVLPGCGNDASFGGTGDKSRHSGDVTGKRPDGVNEPPGDGNPLTPEPYDSLTWFWQCDEDPVPTPEPAGEDDVVVEGTGPHTLIKDRMRGAPVTFSGRLCQPEAVPRDIVLVIDTSGSMNDNDPRIGGSCGRLQAVRDVIAQVPAGQAKIGLVTFNSQLDRASTALFDGEAALFQSLAPGGNIADVVCNAAGGTNYDAGFGKAQELLKSGRAGATKEIYFVSDGQPNAGQDGIAIATSLKNTGVNIGTDFISVTIATVMLAGQDTVLEKFIASRDASGKPLHAFVTDTDQLTKVLTDLTANIIVGGEMRYRPIGVPSDWKALSLAGHLQGFNFTLPSVNIDIDGAPNGLEVLFEYWDKHDNRYSTGGKLLWTADSGDGSGS